MRVAVIIQIINSRSNLESRKEYLSGFECSDEKHCGVFLSFCILFLILFRFQCLLQVSQYIDCWRARTTKYVLVPALVLFILSSLRLYTTKALKTLILQGLSGLFPFHKKTGDERIESLRTLEIPCNYAGLGDFQLAFSGFRMAFSGS